MIRSLDTLVARLLLVSLLGVTLMYVLSLWTYEHALDEELTAAHETRLAERLLSIKRSLIQVPPSQREPLAHDLSGGAIQAHWNTARGAVPGGPGVENWRSLVERVRALAPELSPDAIVIGTSVDSHNALLSLRLPDGSWVNFGLFASEHARAADPLLSISLIAAAVIATLLLMARWLTLPIRRIAKAVAMLSPDDPAPAVPESGPSEVRNLAAAFNAMQRRLGDVVLRRTRALAAVSHDLRTPLTRLKLRLNDVSNPDLQRAMASDIDDMEQMIEATLSYLKGSETSEPVRAIDLVALVETIIDDARDAGRDAELSAPQHLVVQSRLVGLKRAFSNLIGNALRYGSQVKVAIESDGEEVLVRIEDNGPGIPEDKLAMVLEPFVRLEGSRNAETGGVGLGLTIAKANIEACGGALILKNRPQGGLSALARLPYQTA